MSAFLAMVKKELRSVVHERTIMIAIVIQLFIASFSSALLIGLLSLYDPDSIGVYIRPNITVGFLGSPNHPLLGYLRERGVRTAYFVTPADTERAFAAGSVDAILVAPEDRGQPVDMQMFLPPAEARASMILMILQEPLKRYENNLRQQRGIEVHFTDLRGLPPTTFEFLYSVIIPVLMFFPAFVAGSMVVDSLSEEMENKTLETLLSAPVSLTSLVGAKIVAAILLAVMQCIAWLALLRLNHIAIENVALVLALATIIAGMIAVASAFVATVFKTREQSQFVYSLFILAATSVSYMLDASPLKTITRLAIGDAFTGVANILVFAGVLRVMGVALILGTRRAATR
jgi:ABC-2 type transport system permease protein